jgi:hypothetical protein
LDINYAGSRGDQLIRPVDVNQPSPGAIITAGGNAARARPYREFGEILMRETTGRNQYHGLLVQLRHQSAVAGSFTLNYTLSRNRTDSTNDSESLDRPQNSLDLNAEFAAARTDRTHIFTGYYVYELPFFRASNGLRKAALGGWQLAGIVRIESGPSARLIVPLEVPLRPNQVGDPRAGDQAGLMWFDPNAFAPPASGEYGSAPVAPFRLPGRHQWDITISKNLLVTGTSRLQVRADFINAFNQTQFLGVNTICAFPGASSCSANPGFGQITSTRAPRQVQLGMKLHW